MDGKTIKDKLIGNEAIYDVGIFVQLLLIPTLAILGICTIFIPEFLRVTEIMVCIMLIIMAINNHRFFNRTGLTLLYVVVAVIFMILCTLGM